MQWCRLFKLEYPNKAIPADLFSSVHITPETSSSDSSSHAVLDDSSFSFDNVESPWQIGATGSGQADQAGLDAMPFFELAEDFMVNNNQNDAQNTIQDLPPAFEAFPIASARSDREQDLEAALSLVWDALRRSGSSEGMPGSSTHRVLQRLAPELLN